MAFFRGQETHSIDSKGRVSVPAKMRRAISPDAADTFILTRGTDKCIAAYPLNEWKRYEQDFSRLNQYDEKNRFFLRMILGWSEEAEIDSSQRITIPKRFLDFSAISSKVTIVGMIDHLELWCPEEYEKYISGSLEHYEEIAAKVMSPSSAT